MKKLVFVSLCIILCAGIFAGCGTTELESDESIIYVDKKGAVTSLDIETFDKDYYSQEEIKSDIDAMIESYNQEHGKDAVKLESFSVEEQAAKLQIKYSSAEDYKNLIGVELYQGKVVNALSEGYTFDEEFLKVTDGIADGDAEKKDIYSESDLKAVIIKANINVKVPGEICYVSKKNVEVTGKDSVSISDGRDVLETDVYTYIIYK